MSTQLKALPKELLDYTLSNLFSDYLHRLLVQSERPQWDPFRTLPLVSRGVYQSCQTLFYHIFGPLGDDETIHDVLDLSLTYWDRANQPPRLSMPVDDVSEAELKCNNSLVQVYICAALAKSYLNLDVLWTLELEQKRIAGELDDAEYEDMDVTFQEGNDVRPSITTSKFLMRDDNMHRLFLPLTCAIELCDQIPSELAYIVADYLAGIIPFYSTVPIILKSTQDLEKCVSGENRQEMGYLLNSIRRALAMAESTSKLLKDVQETGKLVRYFRRSSSIPLQVVEETKILDALDKVAAVNWGENTPWLNERARAVKEILRLAEREEEPS